MVASERAEAVEKELADLTDENTRDSRVGALLFTKGLPSLFPSNGRRLRASEMLSRLKEQRTSRSIGQQIGV